MSYMRWAKSFRLFLLCKASFCAPLFYKDRAVEPKPTMVEGIAIGKPMRKDEILNSNYKGKIKFILSPEELIFPARDELARVGFM